MYKPKTENWKREIQKLAADFKVPKAIYNYIISETENIKVIPKFYTVPDDYLYDTAQRKLKRYIYKRLNAA